MKIKRPYKAAFSAVALVVILVIFNLAIDKKILDLSNSTTRNSLGGSQAHSSVSSDGSSGSSENVVAEKITDRDDFDWSYVNLGLDSSEYETEKKKNVHAFLRGVQKQISFDYNSVCGKRSCAIKIVNFKIDDLENLLSIIRESPLNMLIVSASAPDLENREVKVFFSEQ